MKTIIFVLVLFLILLFGAFLTIPVLANDDENYDLPDIKLSVEGNNVRIPKEDFEKILAFVIKIRTAKSSLKKICSDSIKQESIEKENSNNDDVEYQFPPKNDDIVMTKQEFMELIKDMAKTINSKLPQIVKCTEV